MALFFTPWDEAAIAQQMRDHPADALKIFTNDKIVNHTIINKNLLRVLGETDIFGLYVIEKLAQDFQPKDEAGISDKKKILSRSAEAKAEIAAEQQGGLSTNFFEAAKNRPEQFTRAYITLSNFRDAVNADPHHKQFFEIMMGGNVQSFLSDVMYHLPPEEQAYFKAEAKRILTENPAQLGKIAANKAFFRSYNSSEDLQDVVDHSPLFSTPDPKENLFMIAALNDPSGFFNDFLPKHKDKVAPGITKAITDILHKRPDLMAHHYIPYTISDEYRTFLFGMPDRANVILNMGTSGFTENIGALLYEGKVKDTKLPQEISNLLRQRLDNPEKLSDTAAAYVGFFNYLHEEPDKKRFAMAEGLSAENLYDIITEGRYGIYTSTFNGLFNRFMAAAKKEGKPIESFLLDEKHAEALPTFIEASASFGRLDELMAALPDSKTRIDVCERILNTLDARVDVKSKNEIIETGTSIAELMRVNTDPEVKRALEEGLLERYRAASGENKKYYGMIASTYMVQSNVSDENREKFEKEGFRQAYPIPKMTSLESKDLFTLNKNVQRMVFADDKDAIDTFSNFLTTYGANGWKIEGEGNPEQGYVKVSKQDPSSGREIIVYANKPSSQDVGNEQIDEEIKHGGVKPSVVIHRGHSTHTELTLPYIDKDVKLVYWGSCGGVSMVQETLERSPDAQVLSTKNEGTMRVNDPLLISINESFLKTGAVQWEPFWEDASKRFKDLRFEDYTPPNKNLGVIFSKTLADAETPPAARQHAMNDLIRYSPGDEIPTINLALLPPRPGPTTQIG